MAFSSIILALFVGFSVLKPVYTLPVTLTHSTLFCDDTGYSYCDWDWGDYLAISCSCNTQPSGQSDLIHYYSLPNYSGFEYNAYGQSETCFDFNYDQWNGFLGTVSSVTLGKDASSCWLYSLPGCVGYYTAVDSNTAKYFSKVASYICYVPVPPPPPGYGLPSYKPTYSSIHTHSPTSIKSTSSNGGVAITRTSSTSIPSYVFPISSSSSKAGIIVTNTLSSTTMALPISSPPKYTSLYAVSSFSIYSPTSLESSTSSKDGVILTTLPTTALPLYTPYLSPPLLTSSESDGILTTLTSSVKLTLTVTETQSPSSPTYFHPPSTTPILPPPYSFSISPSFSSSSKEGITTTSLPTITISGYYPPQSVLVSSSAESNGVSTTSSPSTSKQSLLTPTYPPSVTFPTVIVPGYSAQQSTLPSSAESQRFPTTISSTYPVSSDFPSITVPGYASYQSTPLSSSKPEGVFTSLATPIYAPPFSTQYSSSESDGIVTQPTSTPVLTFSIPSYGSLVSTPSASSESEGVVINPSTSISIPTSTPTPQYFGPSTTLNPIYAPPPPPPATTQYYPYYHYS